MASVVRSSLPGQLSHGEVVGALFYKEDTALGVGTRRHEAQWRAAIPYSKQGFNQSVRLRSRGLRHFPPPQLPMLAARLSAFRQEIRGVLSAESKRPQKKAWHIRGYLSRSN